MEAIAKVSNAGMKVSDEVSESSYGIPVVVWCGVSYGDNDVIDVDKQFGYSFTGLDAKKQLADEYKNDKDVHDWIIKGTNLPTHSERVDHLKNNPSPFFSLKSSLEKFGVYEA